VPSDGSRDGVPEWSVVPRQHLMRDGDQCVIGLG
jgi:hypothetical protein